MASPDPLMQIGAFALAAGVTPSMLRFYDDCGLVEPASVDPVSGYRLYSSDQVEQVHLVRRLREVGLPLTEVAYALEASAADAEAAVRRRLEELEAQVTAARASATAATEMLRRRNKGMCVVDAAAINAGLRRVAPAAGGCLEAPVLAGVLVEVFSAELHLVATDRFRLAAQTLPMMGTLREGRTVLPIGAVRDLAGWLDSTDEVELSLSNSRLTARRQDGAMRQWPSLAGQYPDHRLLLGSLGNPLTRVATPREALLEALGGAPVSRLVADPVRGLRVLGAGGGAPVDVPSKVRGIPMTVAFRRDTLRLAVDVALGPDVVLEVVRPDAPVLVRSADDSTFSMLAMPTLEVA
ncbi:DNA polymerase III subunit beta family protein [Geodermatophilus nigrescens]